MFLTNVTNWLTGCIFTAFILYGFGLGVLRKRLTLFWEPRWLECSSLRGSFFLACATLFFAGIVIGQPLRLAPVVFGKHLPSFLFSF